MVVFSVSNLYLLGGNARAASVTAYVFLLSEFTPITMITKLLSNVAWFCSFDERISMFAEKKFSRDGIELLTGCRVVNVSDNLITMNVKAIGKVHDVPYGMVVWSTGVGTRPIVRDFMEQIGQVLCMCFFF